METGKLLNVLLILVYFPLLLSRTNTGSILVFVVSTDRVKLRAFLQLVTINQLMNVPKTEKSIVVDTEIFAPFLVPERQECSAPLIHCYFLILALCRRISIQKEKSSPPPSLSLSLLVTHIVSTPFLFSA